MPAFEVLHPGALTTVQDLGRPGLAHLGIPRSGAADRASLRLANRLVGNPQDAACLETTLIGPRLRLLTACTIALTGAPVDARASGRPLAMNDPAHLDAGTVIRIGRVSAGLRTYVAVRGGIMGPDWFGSRSTDLLTGIGPAALAAGQRFEVGAAGGGSPDGPPAPAPVLPSEPRLGVVPGPRAEHFSESARRLLVEAEFRVSGDSNRIGVRLEGPVLDHRLGGHLRSEGVAHGSLQVPQNGQPILLLADHPTTGGYPVIGVVRTADLDLAGQLRPGDALRFFYPDA